MRCAVVLAQLSTQVSRHRSSDWDNISLSCRLNHLNKHSRWEEWQDKVSFCSLIRFNWRVPARVSFVLARTLGTRSHSGRLLSHYRPREARNSIYRYREIHIDYRSKFSYWFISSISIIYGNTIWNINSLWPSDTIWLHRSGSTLAQVMACCLTAPSHYLNQCWLFISKTHWHLSKGNFSRNIN